MKKTLLLAGIVVIALIICPLVMPRSAAASSPFHEKDACVQHSDTAEVLASTNENAWADWIKDLSGERPVLISGQPNTIGTRHTRFLFDGSENARAFDYLLERVIEWGYRGAFIDVMPYSMPAYLGGYTAYNLILTIPGTTDPDQQVILSAHLDDTSQSPADLAPGAEDNGSGSALLFEAARLLRYYTFEHTVKIIWFTGEEQGLVGSTNYVNTHDLSGVMGVVNLDMFGYDSDNDRCFELHVGSLAASDEVGQCFVHSIDAYDLNLSYDYLGPGLGEGNSDHASFWRYGVGAVEVLENMSYQALPEGCLNQDRNPYYHTTQDTIAAMNLAAGFDIASAGLATVMDMAVPQGRCFASSPQVNLIFVDGQVQVSWQAVPGAASYRIYRAEGSCEGIFTQLAEVTGNNWNDTTVQNGHAYAYQVEAVWSNGMCLSERSLCQVIIVDPYACTTPPTLHAPLVSYQSITLSWGALVSASSYQVERKLGEEEWMQVAEVTQPTWTDWQVAPGDNLTYRVKAEIQNGQCQTPYSDALPVDVPYQMFFGFVAKG
jgi:hypothetical protein